MKVGVYFYLAALFISFIFFGCKSKSPEKITEVRQLSHELQVNTPATEFTIKIEGAFGTEVSGYYKSIGKQALEDVEIKGTVPITYTTLYCNKLFCRVTKPQLGGYVKVTILDGDKILLRDSTDVDRKYVQMIAYPGEEGTGRKINHDSIIGYVRITGERSMIGNVQIYKNYKQNNSIYSLEGKTPFEIAVTDCNSFGVEAYNDRNVMWGFTCDILDRDKKVIYTKICESNEPGIRIESYDF